MLLRNAVRANLPLLALTARPRRPSALGLVIEGGAIRGVSSAGEACCGLAQLGYSNVFDEVHATSAAVMNAAYFMTNQPLLGISVYFDNCTDEELRESMAVLEDRRRRRTFDRIAADEEAAGFQKLLKARGTLYVAAIDKRDRRGCSAGCQGSGFNAESAEGVRGNSLSGNNRTVEVGGRRYIDGGLAIPVRFAPGIAQRLHARPRAVDAAGNI